MSSHDFLFYHNSKGDLFASGNMPPKLS